MPAAKRTRPPKAARAPRKTKETTGRKPEAATEATTASQREHIRAPFRDPR